MYISSFRCSTHSIIDFYLQLGYGGKSSRNLVPWGWSKWIWLCQTYRPGRHFNMVISTMLSQKMSVISPCITVSSHIYHIYIYIYIYIYCWFVGYLPPTSITNTSSTTVNQYEFTMKFPSCCWLSPNFRCFPPKMLGDGWLVLPWSFHYTTIFLGQYTHQLPHFMAWCRGLFFARHQVWFGTARLRRVYHADQIE